MPHSVGAGSTHKILRQLTDSANPLIVHERVLVKKLEVQDVGVLRCKKQKINCGKKVQAKV